MKLTLPDLLARSGIERVMAFRDHVLDLLDEAPVLDMFSWWRKDPGAVALYNACFPKDVPPSMIGVREPSAADLSANRQKAEAFLAARLSAWRDGNGQPIKSEKDWFICDPASFILARELGLTTQLAGHLAGGGAARARQPRDPEPCLNTSPRRYVRDLRTLPPPDSRVKNGGTSLSFEDLLIATSQMSYPRGLPAAIEDKTVFTLKAVSVEEANRLPIRDLEELLRSNDISISWLVALPAEYLSAKAGQWVLYRLEDFDFRWFLSRLPAGEERIARHLNVRLNDLVDHDRLASRISPEDLRAFLEIFGCWLIALHQAADERHPTTSFAIEVRSTARRARR